VRSTTFVFKAWCTSIQKFVVIHIQTGAQRNEIALAGPRHDVRANAAPLEATRQPKPRLPHAPVPRGSLESSHATCHRLSAPNRWGARHGPPICPRRPAVRASVQAAVPRPHIHGHAVVITGRALPFLRPRFTLARATIAIAVATTAA
jgi:hypothetical protein